MLKQAKYFTNTANREDLSEVLQESLGPTGVGSNLRASSKRLVRAKFPQVQLTPFLL